MDMIVSLHSARQIARLKELKVSHLLINDESFSSGIDGLTKQQMREAVDEAHAATLQVLVKLDRLYDQSELDELRDYIRFLDEIKVDGVLFSDITIKAMVQHLGCHLKTIYAPETLLTNQYDVAELKGDNFSSCVISKDIPLTDVYDIIDYNPGYCYLRVHGPILISYSKRRFISVYLNEKKQYLDHYYLQEESRTNRLPIVEKEKGTWTYGDSLESFGDIVQISQKPLKGIIIDNMLQSDEYTLEIVQLYNQVLTGQMDALHAMEKCKSLDETISYTSINDIKKTFLEKE